MSGGCEKIEVILRVWGFVLSFVAAIVVGLDKQTKLIPLFHFLVISKWQYFSPLVYFLVANIISSSYGLISLMVTLTIKNRNNTLTLLIVVLDTVIVALLSSCSGATLAIGLLGYRGNSHVGWNKVCNVFGRFCKQVAASAVLSLAGAVVFMLLVFLAFMGLQRRPK